MASRSPTCTYNIGSCDDCAYFVNIDHHRDVFIWNRFVVTLQSNDAEEKRKQSQMLCSGSERLKFIILKKRYTSLWMVLPIILAWSQCLMSRKLKVSILNSIMLSHIKIITMAIITSILSSVIETVCPHSHNSCSCSVARSRMSYWKPSQILNNAVSSDQRLSNGEIFINLVMTIREDESRISKVSEGNHTIWNH